MTAQGIFAHKSKQINAIQHQLVTEFHPSIKNVASAGQNLLKAYQNLSRHHYVYTASLYALAFSTSGAEPETREKGVHLERITEALKAIQEEQTKWMEYFTKMTTIIARNCEDEKERLKALQNGFGKREKDLSKAIERGKKNPMEMDKFYERELAEMRDQQTQRYRFFVEKHLEWLQKYLEWTHFSTAILEKELDGNKNGQTNLNLVENPMEKMKENEQEANPPPPPSVQNNEQQNRKSSSQIQVQLEDRQLSLISTSETAMAPNVAIQSQKSLNFQPFGHQQGLFRPIPILPQNQQKYRHSLALTDAVGRANGELSAWERQQMASLPAEHHQQKQQQMMQPVIQQLFYREGPPSNGGLDRIGLTVENENNGKLARQSLNPPNHQQKFQQNGSREASGFQFRHQFILNQKPISPLVTGKNTNNIIATYGNKFISHDRSHSQESTASSGFGAARSTPPIFSAREYGRLVECTTPYEAQGENQLSLGIGQRILLVKNGTRGWVLARSEHGERQGWFPAKYLKLVCDE